MIFPSLGVNLSWPVLGRNAPLELVRSPAMTGKYFHLAMRRGRKIAKVAMARRLAVRMYWMWRKGWDYGQLTKFGSHAGQPGNRHGVR